MFCNIINLLFFFNIQTSKRTLSFDEKAEIVAENASDENKKEILFQLMDPAKANEEDSEAHSDQVQQQQQQQQDDDEQRRAKKEKANKKASSSKAFKLLASETPPPSLDRQDSSKMLINNLNNENDLKLNLLKDALSELEISTNTNNSNSNNETNRKSSQKEESTSAAADSTKSLSTSIVVDRDSISCYLCIKVNTTRDFLTCPLDRRMKNRLRSEFWFQIYDNK